MKKLVLLVEDDENLRATIFDLLELSDFNVVSAGDGVNGLTLAQEIKPDLVFCDLYLPRLDGYGILKELRQIWTSEQMPFILFTSDYDPNLRNRAFQLGANDYLIKPLQIDRLLQAIYNAMVMGNE